MLVARTLGHAEYESALWEVRSRLPLIKVDLPSGRSVRNHDGSVGAANALVLTLMLSIECEMLRDRSKVTRQTTTKMVDRAGSDQFSF